MYTKIFSVFHYPTTLILIDDNARFLQEIHLALYTKNMMSKTFQSPEKALAYLEQYTSTIEPDDYIDWSEDEDFDHHRANIFTKKFADKVQDRNRFKEHAILVVDYAMPNMNGLEFLRKLETNIPFSRILLTGEANETIAVQAFNEGIIQAFVRKDAINFMEDLCGKITALEMLYFSRLVKFLPAHHISKQPAYISFMQKIMSDHHIVEHYLLDASGSQMMLDKNGNLVLCIIRSENELNYYHQLAIDYQSEAKVPKNVLSALEHRSHLLCIRQSNAESLPPSEWAAHLYPAMNLPGLNGFYYTKIEEHAGSEARNILSYGNYCASQT